MTRIPAFLEQFEHPVIPHLGDSGHPPALQLGEDGQWHNQQQPGEACFTTEEGLS